MIKKRELHLTFITSDNRKHTEVLKRVRPDLDAEVVKEVMKGMVELDLPNTRGIRLHDQVASAKLVVVKETILFEMPKQVVPITTEANIAAQQARYERQLRGEGPSAPGAGVKEITLTDMGRFRPTLVADIMHHQLEQEMNPDTITRRGLEFDRGTAIDRYLSNVMKSQLLNELLPMERRISPTNFSETMSRIYRSKYCTPYMLMILEDIQEFFTESEWLTVLKYVRVTGRDLAAELLGDGIMPDYELADEKFDKLVRQAHEIVVSRPERERAQAERMSLLTC